MISADLNGKAAIVTGGGSGIGLEAVKILLRCGAQVAVNYLPGDKAAEAEIDALAGPRLTPISAPGDVADPTRAEEMIRTAIHKLGRLDILINNAGTPGTIRPIDFADLDGMNDALWSKTISVNLLGPFYCVRAAVPALRATRGSIVNTASVAGLGVRGSSIAYAASKAGLINLTRSLATALAPAIRVNAVAPGLVDTPWISAWPDDRRRRTVERTLLGRLAGPEEIAEAMLFLAAGATYMTGQTLVLDGGQA